MRRWLKVGAVIGIVGIAVAAAATLPIGDWAARLGAPETSRVLAGRNSVQGLP